jgi:hypothetical protein
MALFAPNPIALAKHLASTNELILEYQSTKTGAATARFIASDLHDLARQRHWR